MQKYYRENRSHLLLDKLAAYYSTSGLSKRAARLLYEAIRYHKLFAGIDTALRAGKFTSLALLCGIDDYAKLFSGNSTDKAIAQTITLM